MNTFETESLSKSCRQIVIGDVHGHWQGLLNLLGAVGPGREDEVYFLGDLIDRGPHSSQVVELVRQNSYHSLVGNHEVMLLDALGRGAVEPAALHTWAINGGSDSLRSYEDQVDLLFEHVQWIQTLPLYHDLGHSWLVHAGLDPGRALGAQTQRELCWIRDQFHYHPQPYFTDKQVIIGHTITFTFPGICPGELAQGPGWLGVDTGAYHPRSGWLTAIDLTSRQAYQVNVLTAEQRLLPLAEISRPVQRRSVALVAAKAQGRLA